MNFFRHTFNQARYSLNRTGNAFRLHQKVLAFTDFSFSTNSTKINTYVKLY